MVKPLLFIAALIGAVSNAHSQQADERWNVNSPSLAPDINAGHKLPDGSAPNKLELSVFDSQTGMRFQISSETRLTTVEDYFVWRDKLAVAGRAGRASAVLVFDLAQRHLADWFYCIAPKRIAPNWIAYVEWYPRLFNAVPQEVVLLYDLDETPLQNRLLGARTGEIPAPVSGEPVQAGRPIYPESNVQQQSYRNVAEGSAENQTVLAYLPFVMLAGERLVFAGAEGQDFTSSRDFLVVVDLSQGVRNPLIETVTIPTDQLPRPGENPRFVQIANIQAAGEETVKLLLPEREYGVSSILVRLPR